jgi:hypothetical protein
MRHSLILGLSSVLACGDPLEPEIPGQPEPLPPASIPVGVEGRASSPIICALGPRVDSTPPVMPDAPQKKELTWSLVEPPRARSGAMHGEPGDSQ